MCQGEKERPWEPCIFLVAGTASPLYIPITLSWDIGESQSIT